MLGGLIASVLFHASYRLTNIFHEVNLNLFTTVAHFTLKGIH